jgi:hypothetical protein
LKGSANILIWAEWQLWEFGLDAHFDDVWDMTKEQDWTCLLCVYNNLAICFTS